MEAIIILNICIILLLGYIYVKSKDNKALKKELESDLEIIRMSLRHKENMNMDLYTNIYSKDQEIEKLKSKSLNYTITPINNYKKWK